MYKRRIKPHARHNKNTPRTSSIVSTGYSRSVKQLRKWHIGYLTVSQITKKGLCLELQNFSISYDKTFFGDFQL
jgi:hypothetical protein